MLYAISMGQIMMVKNLPVFLDISGAAVRYLFGHRMLFAVYVQSAESSPAAARSDRVPGHRETTSGQV